MNVRKCSKLAAIDTVACVRGWERMESLEESVVEDLDARALGCRNLEAGVWMFEVPDGRVLTFSILYGRALEGRHAWGVMVSDRGFRWNAHLIDPNLPVGVGDAVIQWRAVKWLTEWMDRGWEWFAREHKIPERDTVDGIVRKTLDRSTS